MLFWITVKLAVKSLFANKMRTVLSMLGIIIGVAAVISMLALGAGAQSQVLDQMSAMGARLLIVRPGQRGIFSTGPRQSLMIEDARAIKDQVPAVRQLAPVVRGSARVKYLNKNTSTTVMGVSMTYFPVRNYTVEYGRAFTEAEAEGLAKVAVIGPTTAEDLFDDADPLGKVIRVNRLIFRVIGVLKSKGDQGWFNPDDQVIIPYTTAMKQLLGKNSLREIDIQVFEGGDLDQAEQAITSVLRKQHRLSPGTGDDFYIRNQAEMLEATSNITKTFTMLLGGIASISLLVSGIGIMNIMLVTVTERTREIGVRKAIGAKDRDILRQFLFEALLLCVLGGLLGVGAGLGLARAVNEMTRFTVIVEPSSVLLALSFSMGVGMFFGYYPALRAARLNPVDALRYE